MAIKNSRKAAHRNDYMGKGSSLKVTPSGPKQKYQAIKNNKIKYKGMK
ncbi:hypothetical protein ACFSPU_10885 [Haoranjiania flava]|uniref:Uncharacterized protein n=1 Tax=Haoranjiania flava TaxID=1856322 RepID=A0AAE3ILX4_9BACT|nr:hypothetical protein [Haoranjiania flava]MCU7694284.1 hypothetical protein [Haoranjiania flava]